VPGASPVRAALSPRTAVRPMTSRASLRMGGAENDKKESLLDWFLSKFMHNFQGEGEVYGYEPFFKEIREAREQAQKEEYERLSK
jgi:hypothetical protein